jgi:septal ring factor EnvC (AmiA/AmiB activator)
MDKRVVITGLAALLVGLLAGFLWWGVPTQRLQSRLGETRQRLGALEQDLDKSRSQARAAEAELKATQERLKGLEEALVAEKERRRRLEEMITRGRK